MIPQSLRRCSARVGSSLWCVGGGVRVDFVAWNARSLCDEASNRKGRFFRQIGLLNRGSLTKLFRSDAVAPDENALRVPARKAVARGNIHA